MKQSSIEELRETILHGGLGERLTALGRLAGLENPRTLQILNIAMGDRNHKVREIAARILGTRSEASARSILVDALEDPKFTRRQSAIRALEVMGQERPEGIEALLGGTAPDVAKSLVLKAIGVEGAANLRRETLLPLRESECKELRGMVLELLSEDGQDEGVDDLLLALEDPARSVRARAIERLIKSASPVVPVHVMELLSHPQPAVAQAAVQILTARRDPGIEGLLERIFSSHDLPARLAALTVLGARGPSGARRSLRQALRDAVPEVRQKAVDLLKSSPADDAVAMLLAVIREESGGSRLDAMDGLAQLASPLAVRKLRGFLEDEDAALRIHALQGLVACSAPEARAAVVQALQDPRLDQPARRILAKCEEPEMVRSLVAHWPSRKLKETCLGVLRKMRRRIVLEVLLQQLSEGGKEERVIALELLGELGIASSIEAIEAFDETHTDPVLWRTSLLAIERIRQRAGLEDPTGMEPDLL